MKDLSIAVTNIVNMKSIAIRMPQKAIKELNEIAASAYIQPSTLARSWLMQRLTEENKERIPATDAVHGREQSAEVEECKVK